MFMFKIQRDIDEKLINLRKTIKMINMFKLGFIATVRVFGSGVIGGYSDSDKCGVLAIREISINCPFHVKLTGAR